uniref:GAG-pre-integrase domain-containing protein n=1 Tax=Nicotiana tabacum TaxID=4097 RepID=A0A1S4CHU1_TOBAC|nr:PREDICTED: uncharacterized protein LOC107819164 [Nicotiana tabacum]
MEKNAKARKILIYGLNPDEYNRISACSNTKEIWDILQIAHEGINQVKRSRIELLMRNYKLFSMKESKPIQEMMTRFTIITNELKSLSKLFTSEKLVSKVLRILPAIWESKVTAIKEAKELDKILLDELVGNLKTQEMRKIELRKEEPMGDKAMDLKASKEDESDSDDPDLAMFAKYKKFMKNFKNASKRENNDKPKQINKATYDGKNELKRKKQKELREKGPNKGTILGEGFTKAIKQAFLAAYEDSESDKEEEEEKEDEAISLYVVIDAHQTVETESPVQLRMHIGRPPLFDGHHYDEWKMCIETFLQAAEFDLWLIISHGPIIPTKMDGERNKCNKREEDYDDKDRQVIQKNTKAKDLPYRSFPRNILYKVSSCNSVHDIWRILEADFGDENIEMALMAIEESQTEEEVIGMMAMSDSETEDETNQLISNLSCVKLDLKELESDKADFEGQVKDLKNQVLKFTSKNEKSPDTHGKGKMSDMQDKLEKELKRVKDNLCDAESLTNQELAIENLFPNLIQSKRHNNVYKISIMSLPQSENTCLSVVEYDPLLRHRRLGHASLSQFNKLAAKDLVLELPKVEFTSDKNDPTETGL